MSLDSAYDQFDLGKIEAIDWLKGEIGGLRTGRVKPDLVIDLVIEHYGTRMPLKGAASVSNSDARTLAITPWDPTAIPAIKKAIVDAQLGVQPIEDGKMLRLSFPSLTEEIREQTVKMLHKKAEAARVRLRRSRDESLEVIRKDKADSAITEDDFYDGREKLDTMINQANADIAAIITKKEKDITTM